MECHILVMNYCIKYKYVLKQWKNVVNMMIYKELGNVKIHCLRIIHLYEADLSLVWGVYWRRAMYNAVNKRTLHQGQYGGLPGRDSTTVCFIEELRYEFSDLTRFPLANFDNNASSCYDKILAALASLCGRCQGINRDVIFVHASTHGNYSSHWIP